MIESYKKIGLVIVLFLSLFICTSCNEQQEHKHTYSDILSYDDEYHWYNATCEHSDEFKDKKEHTLEGLICIDCGYEKEIPHKHTYSNVLTFDEKYHWYRATCEHINEVKDKQEHMFVGTLCTNCGFQHQHTYSKTITFDAEYHWYSATCEHSNEVKSKEKHLFSGLICIECGYERDSIDEDIIEGLYGYNDYYHWNYVVYDEVYIHVNQEIHIYEGNTCIKCGYEHYHIYSDKLTYDEEYHWNGAECEHLDQVQNKEAHIFEADICIECGYSRIEQLSFTKNETNDGYIVTSIGNMQGSDIIIPSTFNNLPVVTIGPKAFEYCDKLTSIIIPDSVTSISYNAFANCSNLIEVKIGKNVESIGDYAFYNCDNLVEVLIPEKVISIGNGAFRQCYNLRKVTLSEGLESIEDDAFSGCESLISIIIPNSVTSIGSCVFKLCNNLKIYCKQSSQPDKWNSKWNDYERPVYWNINETNFIELNEIIYIIENNEAKVTAHIGDSSEVAIPSSIVLNENVYDVTSIQEYAFSNDYDHNNESKLVKVTIPDSVKNIGKYAFFRCINLKDIELSNNLESIGINAFYGCISLETILLPESIDSIGSGAFYDCEKLTRILIPYGVTSMGSNVFKNCEIIKIYCEVESKPSEWNAEWNSSKSVYWEINENTYIELDSIAYVVQNNEAIVTMYVGNERELVIHDTITINEITYNVTTIPEYALQKLNIKSIVIPSSIVTIGNYAFNYCTFLKIYCDIESAPSGWDSKWNNHNHPVYWGINQTNHIELDEFVFVIENGEAILTGYNGNEKEVIIPDTVSINGNIYDVTSIGEWVFYGNDDLEKITIGNNIVVIEKYVFYNAKNLKTIIMSDSVTTIKEAAFLDCQSLTKIMIPSSVTSIALSSFHRCSSLVIYCEVESQPSDWPSNWSSDLTVYFGINETNYLELGDIAYLIENNEAIVTKYIGNENEVVIPDSILFNEIKYNVTSIATHAFINSKSITSVTIPESVTSIGDYAFSGCEKLKNIAIPNSVTTIENYTFNNCISLESVTIGNGVTSIGKYAFNNCISLIEITIPDSVTSIGDSAFYNCTSLQYNEYDNGLYLGNNDNQYVVLVEAKNTIIALCEVNERTKIIYYKAFSYCTSLTKITIPDTVTSIGSYAFYYCTSLTIYCEAESKPSSWDENWNFSSCKVIWGYKG